MHNGVGFWIKKFHFHAVFLERCPSWMREIEVLGHSSIRQAIHAPHSSHLHFFVANHLPFSQPSPVMNGRLIPGLSISLAGNGPPNSFIGLPRRFSAGFLYLKNPISTQPMSKYFPCLSNPLRENRRRWPEPPPPGIPGYRSSLE